MVKSCPSCWMTMPGRSCVALTLLICSLERLRISEIQAGQEHGRIRNDSRHAGRKNVSNAKQQYKCVRLPRSITPSAYRHSGIVNVNQAPSTLFLPIELCFSTVCREGRAIFSELGCEIPIELGPGRIPVNMNGNVMNTQFAFREGIAHQALIDILLDLLETVLMAQRMDEGDVRRIQPDLSSESCIRVVNRFRVFLNQATNNCEISGHFILNQATTNCAIKGHFRWRSIPVGFAFCARQRGVRHDLFDFNGIAGEAFAEQFVTGFGDEDVVLDADAEILFGDVDAGLDGDDHAGLQRRAVLSGVVDIEGDMMAGAVNEIRAEGVSW